MANTTLNQFPAGLNQYRINFEYLARPFIVVTLIDSLDATRNRVLAAGDDYRFLSASVIEILTNQTGFDIIQIQRVTASTPLVSFKDGSVLTANDLTVSELQAIHIAEEGRDQTVDIARDYVDRVVEISKQVEDYFEQFKQSGAYGWYKVGTFENGGTIAVWNQVLLQESTGLLLAWNGSMPKTVDAGSTPEETGGFGPDAWSIVYDATLDEKLGLYFKTYATVADAKADGPSRKVGEVIEVSGYHTANIGGGRWQKTATTGVPNKDPKDLNNMYFTDSAGSVFKFMYDPMRGVDLEQLGGKKYDSNDLAGCDTAALWLSLFNYKKTIPYTRLRINTPAREYYSSKGIVVYQFTDVVSPGKLGTQYRIGTNKWTEAEIPHSSSGGVTTWYSLNTFHFAIYHEPNVFAFSVTLSGIDFVTNAGFHTDYGIYVPYYSNCHFSNVNNVGVDTHIYWRNGYSSLWDRVTATARTNTPAKAGSWSVRCQERAAGVGCGTSVVFKNCGWTDFILGHDVTAMTYLHLDTCYTEGTLSQKVGTFVNCPTLTITSYGIERLTSLTTDRPIVDIRGGSGVINGLIGAYNITANGNTFVAVTGGKWVLNGIDGSYVTGASTTKFIYTDDASENLISPVTYPKTGGPYSNQLGVNTFMLGTGGNVTTRIQNAAAAEFTDKSHAVNTMNKWMGKQVYDRTTGGIMSASGPAATDVWRDGAGTLKYTPV